MPITLSIDTVYRHAPPPSKPTNEWKEISLFTPSLLHSPIFDAGFLNVGEGVNKMGNSHETREIKSPVLTHSFLYFTLV